MITVDEIEAKLRALRDERDRLVEEIEADIEDFERMLKRKHGRASKRGKSDPGQPGPFQKKYKEKAVDLVEALLADASRALAVPQMQRQLEEDGKVFHRESISHAMKKLVKAGKAQKQPAPEGSPYKWVYEAKQPRLQAVSTRS